MTNLAHGYRAVANRINSLPLHWIAFALGLVLFFVILVKIDIDWSGKDWGFLEKPLGYSPIRQVLVLPEGELLVITSSNSLKGKLDVYVATEARNGIVKFFNNCENPIVSASYTDGMNILHVQANIDDERVDLSDWLVENSMAWK